MLLNIINEYSSDTQDALRNLWKALLVNVATVEDPKKILSFLNKCAVIGIDEKEKIVWLGIPNDFVYQQVKKFFTKPLTKSVQEIFNPTYKVEIITYTDLQQGNHPLQIDLKQLLKIEEKIVSPLLDESTKTKLTSYFGILFEPAYTFDNFVMWANSELAHSAAMAISKDPGNVYNPFFIYGNVGLGKTHLMQAIWNSIISNNPDKVVLYLPTTRFIDQVIKAIRFNKLGELMQKLDDVDVLMLDDVQFLAGKDKTQEIFHNIFNDFYAKHKQIVVTSDQAPKDLTLLESRLQSRFALGLVADIKMPDHETRVAILQTKLKKKWEQLDKELVDLIAQTVDTNVRELEGALNIVITRKHLRQQELTENDILESLATLGFTNDTEEPTTPSSGSSKPVSNASQNQQFTSLVGRIATYYGLTVDDLKSQKRTQDVSYARQIAMYFAKQQFGRTLERIWQYFGWKNHASVIYSIKTFEERMSEDDAMKKTLKQFADK